MYGSFFWFSKVRKHALRAYCPNVSATPIGAMGLKMGWFPVDNGVCLIMKKGAIWQSHLAAQKEGVVTDIIFSNHKTS